MDKDDEVFASAIKAALNHIARVKEGRELLSQGKPLSEMKTEITGASDELFRRRRQLDLDRINSMTKEELEKQLTTVRQMIDSVSHSKHGGTSEFEWERIMIEKKLEELG